MKTVAAVRAGFIFLMGLSFNAFAIPTYTLEAATTDASKATNFTVSFEDIDGDALLDAGEITSFSGLTCGWCGVSYWDQLIQVAIVSGITDASAADWQFGAGADVLQPPASWWSYSLVSTGDNASVPEPSIAALMASGLIAFGVVRRKRRA